MATTPERVRRALLRVTGAAQAEIRAVAQAAPEEPSAWRAALFAAAPLVVSEYAPAAATLSLDWFEEIREEAAPRRAFSPTPRLRVTDDDVTAAVARITSDLYDPPALDDAVARIITDAETLLEAEVQRQVASGFWDTTTENAADDPESVGWRRFARPEACKFCLMLAARGAVYTQATARFAAHGAETNGKRTGGNCMCIAGPAYGGKDVWAEATPMQYMASRRKRSAEDKARLRNYLRENFPDAPG